jgi:hypothetical protein
MLVPVAGTSDRQAVATAEVDFDTSMADGEIYVFTCDVDCYVKQGEAPVTATAGDGSMFVKAGMPLVIDGREGAKLSVIRKDTDGAATLQRMKLLGA